MTVPHRSGSKGGPAFDIFKTDGEAMFAWFEKRIDPYPQDVPGMPPRTLGRFLLHYSRGALPWLVLLCLTSGMIALIEVAT